MSNYSKSTNFATKDNLTPGDPLKIVRGTEIDTEFNNIATAIATKTDNASAAIVGGTINDTTIGATTASTGAFTTLAASGAVTLSGGTANGVAYLNGSKVVTSGSALTFDGTNFKTTGSVLAGGGAPASGAGVTLTYNGTTGNIYSYDWGTSTYKAIGLNGNSVDISAAGNTQITFGINGSEQMRLTSTGLGIGTSSPSTKLTVYAGADGDVGFFRGGSTRQVQIGTSSTAGYINTDNGSAGLELRTNGTARATIDTSGNLGLGVTPSASSACTNIELPYGATLSARSNTVAPQFAMMSNAVGDWFSPTYKVNGYATQYTQQGFDGTHKWYNAPSGTAGNAITFTQAMTLTASGNLGIGNTSPDSKLVVEGGSGTYVQVKDGTVNTFIQARSADSSGVVGTITNHALAFYTSSTEKARIDSSGSLLVGATSDPFSTGANLVVSKTGTSGVSAAFIIGGYTSFYAIPFASNVCNSNGFSTSATANVMGFNSGTGRSLNAGGTLNASGADYAEYMTKSGDFTVAKGDVVGINAQGKLTNVFADAVSFVVKSTDPSYVGGDTWGSVDVIGLRPNEEATQAEKDAYEATLEAARQAVDRIAFAGQVPVNVLGATAGQYIIPVNDNGAIKGQAVSNPTFEQYQSSVGKVIAIEADGRARIIVKVA